MQSERNNHFSEKILTISPMPSFVIEGKEGFLEEELGNLEEKIQGQLLEVFSEFNQGSRILATPAFSPMVSWVEPKESGYLKLFVFVKKRPHVVSFFYEMISRWLIPYTPLPISLFFSCDLKFNDFPDSYTFLEAHIFISSSSEMEEIRKQKRVLDTEFRLGLDSEYHATRILEFKGCSQDRKTGLIQEKIAALIRSRSKDFGQSIFSSMQHFLVTSSEEFKQKRDSHHISRIISILFFMQKLLKKKVEAEPQKRHIMLKFIKTKINQNEESFALGILVGINFLKEHEVFEKKHLLRALKNYFPNISLIEESYYVDTLEQNKIQTMYLEIQKTNKEDFFFQDVALLKERLPDYLNHHIEKLVYPVFMPRNEEEILRNITILSRQLRYVHDIPQVILSFEGQSDQELSFTVIVLRLFVGKAPSLEELSLNKKVSFRLILDRIKNVGVIRRKYMKEATVFRAVLPIHSYLRLDHSIDFMKAREKVLEDLTLLIGEVRDYNGGLMAKQSERFIELKKELKDLKQEEELVLEKFFYSLKPISLSLIVSSKQLKELFLMLLNAIKRDKMRVIQHKDWLFKQELKSVSILIPMADEGMKKKIDEALEKLDILSSELLSFSIHEDKVMFLGYLYFSENIDAQKSFLKTIQLTLDF